MINLDDKQQVLKIQGNDSVLKSVDSFSKQVRQSFLESLNINFPASYQAVKNIVVCGMGGSRFTPLIIKELFKEKVAVPYVVNDNYQLPGFVGQDTLVILSSYSGTTEEVLTCGKNARQKGALLTGLSAGGETAQFLKNINSPYYVFNPVYNPSNQPRIGSGYMIGGHLGILIKLNLIKINKEVVISSIAALDELIKNYKIDVPTIDNFAKQLALQVYNHYPYFIVSEFLTGVGNAIANQTNETAKSISSFRVIPELNHHLMEGLKFPNQLKELAIFVLFYSDFYTTPVQKRFKITEEVVKQNKIKTVWHKLKGKNEIEQALELIGFGSYFSMYLSALYKQNPATIPYVDYFKKKLREMS